MKAKFILPILALLAVGSCDAQKKAKTNAVKSTKTTKKPISETVKSTYPQSKPASNVIRLKEGENIFSKDAQMNLTFTQAIQDSRCPMNARCVWAGNATIEIEVMGTTTRPMKFNLSTGDLKKDLVNSAEFNGYKISLENLYPSTSTDHGFKDLKGKYVADIKVEKLTN